MTIWIAIIGSIAKRAFGALFDTRAGLFGFVAATVAAFLAWFALEQRQIGAMKVAAKIEAQNAKADKVGSAGARASNRGGRGSVLDPTTRADP